jgi:hypothetical protein
VGPLVRSAKDLRQSIAFAVAKSIPHSARIFSVFENFIENPFKRAIQYREYAGNSFPRNAGAFLAF